MNAIKHIECFEYDKIPFGDLFTAEHREQLFKLNKDKKNFFVGVDRGVKCTEFVGTVQVNDLRITVLPKTSRYGDTELWRSTLFHLLKHTRELPLHKLGYVNSKNATFDLIELYFDTFLSSLEQLIAKGLVKRYRTQESNQPCLKGKLLFNQHIKHNLVHKERFYTAHTTYDAKHLIHQVFAETLEVIRQHSRSQPYKSRVRRTQERMPELKRLKITKAMLDGIRLDRKTAHYAECFNLARLILMNCSPGLNLGEVNVFGMMFNMFDLWERYILRCLQSVNSDCVEAVKGQKPNDGTQLSFWENRKLKPDITVILKNHSRLIIDTKWKVLKDKLPSIADLRQMYAYHHFGKAEKTLLLYPSSDSSESGSFEFKPFKSIFQKNSDNLIVPEYISQPCCAIGEISIFEDNDTKRLYQPAELGKLILQYCGLEETTPVTQSTTA